MRVRDGVVPRRARRLALAVLLAVPATAIPAAAARVEACAATLDGGPHAGLVVDAGAGAAAYCVGLDAATVSGIHLIELASAQYGLQYRLGFGGKAVCQLQGVGPDGDDCFAMYPDFWGYWHHDTGEDGWTWASAGAASAVIADGDMDGWTWGSGDTGATHPPPPALRFDDVCEPEPPSPTPTSTPPSPRPTHPSSAPPPQGGSGFDTPDAGAKGAEETKAPQPDRRTASPSKGGTGGSPGAMSAEGTPSPGSPTAPPASVVAAAARSDPGGGLPVGTLIAVAAVLVFAVGGVVRLRANRKAQVAPPGS